MMSASSLTYELPRTLLLRRSVNRVRGEPPGRARTVCRYTSRSGWALVAVPPYGTPDGFSQRRRSLAELSLESGVIYDEWFLELVEHLDRLAQGRVEDAQGSEQDLRCRLDACWLANLLEDHLHERSEEHTSELQSRQYLVCRLLLEKKKKNNEKT